jgi:hypothetical protein
MRKSPAAGRIIKGAHARPAAPTTRAGAQEIEQLRAEAIPARADCVGDTTMRKRV